MRGEVLSRSAGNSSAFGLPTGCSAFFFASDLCPPLLLQILSLIREGKIAGRAILLAGQPGTGALRPAPGAAGGLYFVLHYYTRTEGQYAK